MNFRRKPVIALVASAAMVGSEVMIHDKALTPNQHVEVPVPVEESVLTYNPASTPTVTAMRLFDDSLLQYPDGPQFRVVRRVERP
jgi:hypothetical protein